MYEEESFTCVLSLEIPCHSKGTKESFDGEHGYEYGLGIEDRPGVGHRGLLENHSKGQ